MYYIPGRKNRYVTYVCNIYVTRKYIIIWLLSLSSRNCRFVGKCHCLRHWTVSVWHCFGIFITLKSCTEVVDMHHYICQFCHTDLYAKILTFSTCTCTKETTFFTISTSWWTLNCPSFSSSSYGNWDMHQFICHTDLYAEGAKILTFSTCTCTKETTFFTISTSWWTLNCPSFSSSSYGYWDMHHYICQFCHTDLYAEGAKILTFSTCRCAKETTFFTISTSWWTLNCPSFSSSSYGNWDMHKFICHTDLYAEGAKILTFSTCTCAKETTFFTISTSWWTLNCPSFSSSSYGNWDMQKFICHTDLYAEGAKILTFSTCTCAKETTFFTISTSWWTLNCPSFSSSSYGYWDMHHYICQFCHTDLYAKILTFSTCTCTKETTFFTISTSWWTLNCPSFSSSSYGNWDMHKFICHTDLYAEGAKILTFSTCTCAKETTFFTISTSWWTLNCPSFSSSSYGNWDMHQFICHTDLYAEGAKILTFSTCTCAKETTFFTISTSWWTLNCPSFSSSSYGYWDMHHYICQFCHTNLYAKILTFSTCTCTKETTFFTISTSWWTLNCPSFSSSSYGNWDMHQFICHTDLYAEGAKILTFSTCTCAKETTFFTISTSWWTLNCPSFSSSSYGNWDMHHYICQFLSYWFVCWRW